jgi:pyruvate dehydrogenase E2 component (dihydrolipoamide acetyltransferase)
MMAETIVMPRQGNSVESCVLLKWRVKEGDEVQPKTIVADVETDKASFEVEAGVAGTVLKLVRSEGDDVPVMQPIAYVGKAGEALPGTPADAGAAASSAPPPASPMAALPTATASAPASSPSASAGSSAASPRARLLAASQGVDATGMAGTGPGGRVIERDVRAALSATAPATPAAIEAALKSGVKLPAHGTGIGGRVTVADVAAAPASVPSAPVVAAPSSSRDFPGKTTETKVKGIRKLIADRMAESLATTAQFTLNASAVAVRLQELRARLKASDPALGLTGVTIGDLVVYATSRTLKRFPSLNAHFVRSSGGDTIVEFESVHIGVACDTPRGLMVPVVRNADTLSLKQISDETKRLADACRGSAIKPDELNGSTFSVSNVGAFGIESFTPVLNLPEVAILGVGGIGLKPVQKGSDVAFLPHVGLSLTINHMVVDGAPAAKFLKALCDAIAEVDLLLAY